MVADILILPILQTRRYVQDIVFLYTIVNGLLDYSDIGPT